MNIYGYFSEALGLCLLLSVRPAFQLPRPWCSVHLVAVADLVELEQLHEAIERLRLRTQTRNRLLHECTDLESRCKKAEERVQALQRDV